MLSRLRQFSDCLLQPIGRECSITRNPFAALIHQPQLQLRRGIALLGRLSIPMRRFDRICYDAHAVSIDHGEIVLGHGGVAVLGRLAKPTRRLDIVLRDAFALEVQLPRLTCALTCPCSAAVRYHFAAMA